MKKNEEIKLTAELTPEEISAYDEKAKELSALMKCEEVHPVVLIDKQTLERIVCYVKEPNFETKIRVMDKAVSSAGLYTAANELREACTIKEYSDQRTFSESTKYDKFKMGVVDFCMNMISRSQNQFKKK